VKEVAAGVWQFEFLWFNAINAYYVEGDGEALVVDASTRWDWPSMRRQLRGLRVTGVLLTHAHPDHQGCAAKICQMFNVPLIVHEADAESARGGAPLVRQNAFLEVVGNIIWAGKRSPVGRLLKQGDRIAGFTVHHMPGHTRGQVTLFRERDGVAIVGDIFATSNPPLPFYRLREPPFIYSIDPAENRHSIRKFWELAPKVVCAGHGPVLRDMALLEHFVGRLPRDHRMTRG
jgi:glyoxylase-like metal-dependent hydrolase (beta-lactamase superfamily II)